MIIVREKIYIANPRFCRPCILTGRLNPFCNIENRNCLQPYLILSGKTRPISCRLSFSARQSFVPATCQRAGRQGRSEDGIFQKRRNYYCTQYIGGAAHRGFVASRPLQREILRPPAIRQITGYPRNKGIIGDGCPSFRLSAR